MKFAEFMRCVRLAQAKHPEWRIGQTTFNVLYGLAPKLADEIRGTDLDPFHHNDRLPNLYAWLNDKTEDFFSKEDN